MNEEILEEEYIFTIPDLLFHKKKFHMLNNRSPEYLILHTKYLSHIHHEYRHSIGSYLSKEYEYIFGMKIIICNEDGIYLK